MGAFADLMKSESCGGRKEKMVRFTVVASKKVIDRIKWLRGAKVSKPGRPGYLHSYESAFRRLFVFLDAVGWEPLPVEYDWMLTVDSKVEYDAKLAEFEERAGRMLKLHERVLFAQLAGYGVNEMVKREWILGPYFSEVKENLEGAAKNLGEDAPELAPVTSASGAPEVLD